MQILVVEDDPDIRSTLEQILGDAGYAVSAAGTAAEALRLVAVSTPDLVLLDLMLPDRPGGEVCRALRADPRTHAVPVIMVTARAGEEGRVAGLEQGADDYVEKPFSMRELLLRIEAVLKRNRRPAARPRIDSGWATAREQIRVWDGFSANHFERGEWEECLEICRTILRRYGDYVTAPEIALLHDRIRRCDNKSPVPAARAEVVGAFPEERADVADTAGQGQGHGQGQGQGQGDEERAS
jgi:DNA-binding response OmpR family regulator